MVTEWNEKNRKQAIIIGLITSIALLIWILIKSKFPENLLYIFLVFVFLEIMGLGVQYDLFWLISKIYFWNLRHKKCLSLYEKFLLAINQEKTRIPICKKLNIMELCRIQINLWNCKTIKYFGVVKGVNCRYLISQYDIRTDCAFQPRTKRFFQKSFSKSKLKELSHPFIQKGFHKSVLPKNLFTIEDMVENIKKIALEKKVIIQNFLSIMEQQIEQSHASSITNIE